ncbi:MAG: ABC transporter ATP-binding protein [Chloroflexota bacterium]
MAQTTKQKGFFAVFSLGLRSMARYPRSMALFIVGALTQALFQALLVWALQHALLTFSDSSAMDFGYLTLICIAIFAISIIQSIGTYVAELMSMRIAYRVQTDSMRKLYAKTLSLPVRYFEKNSQGDLIMASFQDLSGIRQITEEVGRTIVFVTRLSGLALAAVLISPKLALVGFVAIPLVAAPASWFGQRMSRAALRGRNALAVWHDSFLQVSSGIKIIKVNRGEERILAKGREVSENLYVQTVDQFRNKGQARLVLEIVSGIGLILVLAVGGRDVAAGELSWQSLLSLLIAVLAVYSPIVSLLQTYSTVRGLLPNLDRVDRLMETPAAMQNQENAQPLRQTPAEITLKDLTFAYNDQTILNSISATFYQGETIGIVGPSGTGKSTFISLLLRFYEPTGGQILFDGVDLRDIRYADLLDNCAIVLQEPILFVDSVANNIRLARPDATMEEVIDAAKAANIHDEIMRMENGYETMLGFGEDSRGLSVGQKQRICIAAALLKNAPILFLDEATSNLDAVSERKVQDAIDRLMIGRTSFVIAHRLSALRNADRILVLERGNIVGFAPHAELLETCETYYKLWSYQSLDSQPNTVSST